MLRRTTGILRRTSTVLNGVLKCGFNSLGGACHGGNHGHASFRLPGNGVGSLHGHRNGACNAPTIGAVKSLLSTLPPAAPMAGIRYWLAEVELLDSTHYEVAKAA